MKAFALLCACAVSAAGSTFTVTTTNDAGAGSLREAITLVNAIPGAHEINFSIGGANVHTIAPLTALPTITNTVMLDGYSQPGAVPNTLAAGNNAVLSIRLDGANLPGLTTLLKLTGTGHTVRGLVIVRATNRGIHLENCSNTTISGNWIGLDVDNLASGNSFEGIYLSTTLGSTSGNVIGGTAPGARNIISGNWDGILLFGSSTTGNTIAGNFIGTDATGTLGRGNIFNGIYIQAGLNNVIGGASSAARNIISANGTGNTAGGIYLLGGTATTIQNNFIGTDVSGSYELGNGSEGVGIQSSTIKACTVADNLICANRGNGITILGSTNVFQRNTIGTDLSGARQMGNQGAGISIFSGVGNTIGGIGASNTIRFNLKAGLEITGGSNNVARANVITDNRGLPIDLGTTGSDTNDPGDLDAGPNGLQNFPVITNSMFYGGPVLLSGYLDSTPSATFTLDFYAGLGVNLLGQPQAQMYLGSTNVTTDGSGNGAFNIALSAPAYPGWLITATATDAAMNTSEFAAGVAAQAGALSAPSLSIQSAAGTNVVSWPSATGAWQLQTTYSMTPPVQWQTVSNGIQDNGTLKTYTPTPATFTNQFFRLKLP